MNNQKEITMKKVTLLIALAALVVFAGCKKEKDTAGTVLKASIEQNKGEGRTSLNPANGAINWTAGDKILVNNGTSNATFTLTGGAGTTYGTFVYAGDYEFGTNNVAVYPETATISGNTMSLTLPATQAFTAAGTFGNGANPMLGTFADSESLVFTSLCGGLGISLTGNTPITGIEIVSWVDTEKLNGAFEADCTAANPVLTATAGNAGTNKVMLNCATTLTSTPQSFIIVLPVGTLSGGFTMNVYNGGTEPIFTMHSQNLELVVELNTVKMLNTLEVEVAGGGDEHAYVDLGLPSGLLWATCNVGATTPEGYGDYFAWGETTPKDTYNWSNYQYYDGSNVTKYIGSDGLTTLLPEDDAATANWGSDWRMPTNEEVEELFDNTTYSWTTQNGVNGCLITASNGNSLFLPATGYRQYSSLYEAGSKGDYWSSSRDIATAAMGFGCQSDTYIYLEFERYYGFSVRPVRCKNSVITVNANPTAGGMVSGGGTYMDHTTCTLTATANSGYTFENWTENGTVVSTEATYTFTVSGNKSLVANFTAGTGGHAYVDLGLPSGLLWATCNVGADTPEGYGDYFAWGETEPKSVYTWSTYQYGDGETFTKYTGSDGLTTLLAEDDAATANWDNGWRMPTQSEFQELLDNTTVTWTQQNGVNGRLFTASNGNSLFLPAAGYRFGSDHAGGNGDYWSSSLYTVYPYSAWDFSFDSDYYGMTYYGYRSYGQSVRAVRSGL
jgi:hypothetical protein